MQFEYPEDQEFFAHLFAEGDVNYLNNAYSDLFDFRHPAIKRFEFDKVRKKVLKELLEKYNGECQLHIHPECTNEGTFEPDHIVPLSSNILNKELRKTGHTSGAKVVSQSFGSNHSRNLTLACKRCNAFKKNKILTGTVLHRLLSNS